MSLSGTLTASGTLSGGMSRSGSVSGGVSAGQPRILVDGVLKGDGAGNISAAVSGIDYAAPIKDEAEGAVAHFTDGAAGPVDDLTIDITPVQAGTGNPSPTNVRAISGWTGATIYQSGEDTSDPSTTSISWNTEAGTVYGGTLDVTTGLLTVTYVKDSVSEVTGVWGAVTNGYGVYVSKADATRNEVNPDLTMLVSNRFKYSKQGRNAAELYNYGGPNGAVTTITFILPNTVTSKAEANAWFASNPTDYTYQLATPLTYQLTPTQVTSLLGENNIWSDTGDTKVRFYADTKLYIQQLTQPTEDDMVANANIASGKYYMVGNNLYYSTASIANGAKIIVGTNCNQVTLAAALNAINS